MSKIWVDADACPKSVRDIIASLTLDRRWEMITVASFNHRITGSHRHITVDNEPQAVDIAIGNLCRKGDLVVTQDWGLAAMVMGKGCRAVSPHGVIFQEEKIEFLLEERYQKEKIRRAGGRTKGPAARNKEDDIRFRTSLEKLLI